MNSLVKKPVPVTWLVPTLALIKHTVFFETFKNSSYVFNDIYPSIFKLKDGINWFDFNFMIFPIIHWFVLFNRENN